jgi:hypothetical protein
MAVIDAPSAIERLPLTPPQIEGQYFRLAARV